MADRARIYRALLKLYPARFREEFERPLEQQFRDDYEESRGGILFWTRVLADLAVSVPLEFARELRQDLRYSFRIYARRPWVTILAVAALAMAIGATTGVFSVVNALLLRSLPFRNPESLVLFSRFPLVQFIPGGFKGWEAKARYLSGAAPFMVKEMNLVVGGAAMRRKITETSAGFFPCSAARLRSAALSCPMRTRPAKIAPP